jgi:hypothetical protein
LILTELYLPINFNSSAAQNYNRDCTSVGINLLVFDDSRNVLFYSEIAAFEYIIAQRKKPFCLYLILN